MKPTLKQLHILKLWEIEAEERYTGASLRDDGNMVVYILQRAVTMSSTTTWPMRFIYDQEGNLIECFTPGMNDGKI